MQTHRTKVLTLLLPLAFAACDPAEQAPLSPADHGAHTAVDAARAQSPDVLQWLARLRATLAPLHDFETAKAAGYNERITGCFEQPGVGGMGFHWGNVELINGSVDPLAPELLLFEPQKNGRMRLVGVEYIVPFTAWTGAEPPEIHGIAFHENFDFGLWVLHVWTGRNNPDGIFEDWNPVVSCEYAS